MNEAEKRRQRIREDAGRRKRVRLQALELRLAGKSYREISLELDCSVGLAHKAVDAALREYVSPRVDQLRAEETAKIDRAAAAIWPAVLRGDLAAVGTFVRLSERKSRLHGLDSATRVEHVGGIVDGFVVAQGWSIEHVLGVLRDAIRPVDAIDGILLPLPPVET